MMSTPSYRKHSATGQAVVSLNEKDHYFEGSKVDIDPASYKVTGGRLFLFYKGLIGDALKKWN